MTESEVEFRDISLENVAQQSAGAVGASILTGLSLCLFVWAWRRDNSISQQRAKRESMVCMTSRIFGSQLVPEGNCQYGIITDSSQDQLDKIWHIFKLRVKHKHRWISVFTRTENTRFQTRERVLVLYSYILSVFTFAAIFHGQKARVAGVAGAGILSSLFSILPTFCLAQLFKNSRSEDPSRNVQRKKSLRDYDNDDGPSAQDEYRSNNWNARAADQNTTNCGMFFATLCGGHLDSQDTLEYSSQKAFSPAVNLFTYFAALAWTLECVVLIIAFTVQFDLIPIEMPEATAWGLSILVAALWDFLVNQPTILLVLSMATVFTTKMFKGGSKNGHEEQSRSTVRKKSSRKKERRDKKEARKELTVTVGSTRGKKTTQDDYEIKTEPVTVGRTKGGAMREMRVSDASPRGRGTAEGRSLNFLIDGEADTKRLHSNVHEQGEAGLGTPSNSNSNTFVTASSSSVPEVSPPLPASPSTVASAHLHPPTFQPSPDPYDSATETPETSDSEESAAYKASQQNHLIDIPTSRSTLSPLDVVPNVTHPHETIRGRKLKSRSFVAAMSYHQNKRNSIQPPSASFLAASLASPSGRYQQDDDPTDA